MEYFKSKVWRKRDLNSRFYEVLFEKRSLNLLPGDSVKLYNLELSPVFVASGLGEVWVRIILDRSVFPDIDFGGHIKLHREVECLVPDLMSGETPSFAVTASGIMPFLSYSSTYPERKCKVCYLGGDKIHEDWVDKYHEVVGIEDIKKAANLYVIGENDLLQGLAAGSKFSYFI